MEKNQKINCTVTSCKYNDEGCQECKLEQIIVTPIVGCNTKQSDESMCSSYRNNKKQVISLLYNRKCCKISRIMSNNML